MSRLDVASRVVALTTLLTVLAAWAALRSQRNASHAELTKRELELHRYASIRSACGEGDRIAAATPASLRLLFGQDRLGWSRRGDAAFLTFDGGAAAEPLALRGGR